MWKDIVEILKKPLSKLPLLIIAGTVPTALISGDPVKIQKFKKEQSQIMTKRRRPERLKEVKDNG